MTMDNFEIFVSSALYFIRKLSTVVSELLRNLKFRQNDKMSDILKTSFEHQSQYYFHLQIMTYKDNNWLLQFV